MRWLLHAIATRRAFRAAALAATCAVLQTPSPSKASAVVSETRSVADFDSVAIDVPADVSIAQGARETLRLEAETAVLPQLTSEVRDHRLVIGIASSRLETHAPIRITLGVRNLRAIDARAPATLRIGPLHTRSLALELNGGGSVRVDRLDGADSLAVRITGAGDVAVGGGQVQVQHVAIRGMGTYAAPGLASASAEVAIDGNGDARLAASATLAVRIGGMGRVRYHGDPAVSRSIRGVGSVEKD